MKYKIILRYQMDKAKNRGRIGKQALGTKAIVPLLKRAGLKKTKAGTWCRDDASLEAATGELREMLRIFGDPRNVPNTTGKLGHLFLYIEQVELS
jgi:hypothetical protein